MAKLPLYEQQTSVGSVRASAQDFGAGMAQATGEMGGVVNDIGMQMKRRQDVIERVQLMTEFDKFAQDALTTLNDTEDISSPATVEKYSAGLREKASEVVKRHGGTGQSRAELQAQIDNQVGQYTKSVTATQVKAQQQFIGTMVDQKANELAISAAFAPDKMGDLFADMDRTIDSMADAMSPGLAAQYKEAGRSRIATNAIQQLLVQGQAGTAKKLMESPEVGKYLGADAARKFAIDITVDQRKNELETQRQDKNVASWSQRMGRNLTPEEVIKVRSMPEKKDMTVADQIVEYELITGKPAPQSVVDQFYKVDGPGSGASMFGNSLQGRALSFVTENAVAYANGMLTPEQARIFEASAAEAYKPVMRPNPVTGQLEEVRPTIPNFVTQAMDQGGRAYGGMTLTNRGAAGNNPLPGQTVQLTDSTGRVIGRSVVGPNGTWTIQDQNPQSAAPSGAPAGGVQPSPAGEKTIWEMADDISGPVPAAQNAAGRIPFVGGMLDGGGEVAKNRSYVKTQVSQMVDALSINPRNPVALVEMIRKEIDVDPQIMDDPAAYRKRIEGVNRSLTERLIEETNAGNDPTLPAKTRQDALEVANTIRNFQQKLMPPQVKNLKELQGLGLPPGSKFVDPNGVLRQVP